MFSDTPPSKRVLKEMASLDSAKWRRRTGLFVAEGTKCVTDLNRAFVCRYLFYTTEWYDEHSDLLHNFDGADCYECTPGLMREITRLSNTPPVIAAFMLPQIDPPLPDPETELVVALDGLQDPGNLGTIIRTADWMGVRSIVVSKDTVDAFNPKTVQATMGALARVKVITTDLPEWLAQCKAPVYGTFLNGENIYRCELTQFGVVVMGNEGHGVGPEVAQTVDNRLFIPSFPPDTETSESLNVATATAITLSEFRSRYFRSNG